jgi:hypothetical protein
MHMKSQPCVSVIVLNWNGKDDTLACLETLQAQRSVFANVIVVDNGSNDGSVSAVRNQYPNTTVIETGANLGYAGGNNVGISYALDRGAEYILVLNNDTVLDSHCVAHLVDDLEQHPRAAAAAPKSYFFDAPDTIYFAGGRILPNGGTVHIGRGSVDHPDICLRCDTEWITGCAMMFTADALQEIGAFESRFFVLFEDADWSLRARKTGYRLRFVPKAKLWHKVSVSFGEPWSPLFCYYFARNSFLWVERSFPRKRWPACFLSCITEAYNLATTERGEPSHQNRKALKKAVVRGVLDYVFRRFGQRSYEW